MKREIRLKAIAVLLAILAICVVLIVATKPRSSPAQKWLKANPYTFETAHTLGKERQEETVRNGGVIRSAHPETGVAETDRALRALSEAAEERFRELAEAEEKKDKKERRIPLLTCDYRVTAQDALTEVYTYYSVGYCAEDGGTEEESAADRYYYVDKENRLLDLDAAIGEDTQAKLEIMLRKTTRRIAEMRDFRIDGDQLVLRWGKETETFSVKEVQRANLIDPDKPMVALTFDDGPGGLSKDFADLLAQYGARGTFFMLGENVEYYAENAKYVYDMGNEIGSHTMHHRNLNLLSEDAIRSEIDEAAAAIEEATGVKPVLLRTPYGNANSKVREVLNAPMISWSVDTEDWRSREAQAVRREIVNGIYDGAIILMHEIYGSTYNGLKLALEDLKDEGYQFVTVSELMQYRCGTPENKIYYDFPPEED